MYLKRRWFKMRVDDVASNIWLALVYGRVPARARGDGAGDGTRGVRGCGGQCGAGAGRGLTFVHCSAELKRILWDRGALMVV